MCRRFAGAWLTTVAAGVVTAADAPGLLWQPTTQVVRAQPGDSVAAVMFAVRNASSRTIVVDGAEPSCDCTTAELPAYPWRLDPGASGALRVKVDLIGKSGDLHKSIVVRSSAGTQTLEVHVIIPAMGEAVRAANRAAAERNRQAVFTGDCARCHAAPARGKEGAGLFQSACAICHASSHRASMVPALAASGSARDSAFWRDSIAQGRPGTLMPAFAERHGGPLTSDQIESLVEFLVQALPVTSPRPAHAH